MSTLLSFLERSPGVSLVSVREARGLLCGLILLAAPILGSFGELAGSEGEPGVRGWAPGWIGSLETAQDGPAAAFRSVNLAAIGPAAVRGREGGIPLGLPQSDTLPRSPAETWPPDSWRDAEARTLLLLAQGARGRLAEGLESYQGRLRERLYLGVDGASFRREREVITDERLAMIRWSAEGERRVTWLGARRDAGVVGVSSARDSGAAARLARELGTWRLPPPLAFDPGSDRLRFGEGEWALHPLSDTAGFHYRYESGETLRLRFPGLEAPLELRELRVEPRRSDFRLVAASLWFDARTGDLVRAVYRPARPFNLALDGGEDVPWLLGSVQAEIRVVTIDHGLHDLIWWIPRRYLFEGEATVGRLLRFPLQAEWEVDEIEVNIPPAGLLADGALPDGWQRIEREVLRRSRGDSVTVIRGVPPAGELADGLPPRVGRAGAGRPGFTPAESRDLEGRLGSLLPTPGLGRFQFGLGQGEPLARFNRIEGLAAGVGGGTLLPGGVLLSGHLRGATHAPAPTGEVRVGGNTPGQGWHVSGYRRLVGASEWEEPGGLGASIANAYAGEGPTPWYRAWGGSVGIDRTGGRPGLGAHRVEWELFAERQGHASVGTGGHLRRIWGPERPAKPNITAVEGTWAGIRAAHRWQGKAEDLGVQVFGLHRLEIAGGRDSYARGSATLGLLAPLGSGWSAALEAGAGQVVGDAPLQRSFFPGGPRSYRAGRSGEVETSSYLLGRAELGRGRAGARLVTFADVLAPGDGLPRRAAVGVGLSLLDGLARLDVAREIEPERRWRLLAYLDALF